MVSREILQLVRQARGEPCDAHLAELGKIMVAEHVHSEAYHEAMRTAYAASADANEQDDFEPLGEIALKMQSKMYEHNKKKNKLAIEIVDTLAAKHPRSAFVQIAQRILDGHADIGRVAKDDRASFLEGHEQLVRSVAKDSAVG